MGEYEPVLQAAWVSDAGKAKWGTGRLLPSAEAAARKVAEAGDD